MTVRNTGRGTAIAARVCDRVPKGLKVVRAPGATITNGQLCWRIRVLRPGGRRRYVVRVQVKRTNHEDVIVNVVQVSGLNSNCSPLQLARRAQRAACSARARVRILKSAALPARVQVARPPFTG
jgi:hypothetical protein